VLSFGEFLCIAVWVASQSNNSALDIVLSYW